MDARGIDASGPKGTCKMKILVMNLLRAGDVIQTAPMIAALHEKYPDSQIHLLVNSSVRTLVDLIPGVKKVHLFDREDLQYSMANPQAPIFQALDKVDHFVRRMNAENYDEVYNFSQNKLTALFLTRIHAARKFGLFFDELGRPTYSSSWYRYMNDYIAQGRGEVFHYTDIYRWGAELEVYGDFPSLQSTESGEAEADQVGDLSQTVCLQALSSDVRKNWSFSSWEKSLREFNILNPGLEYLILAAPGEDTELRPLLKKLNDNGLKARVQECSFAGAFSILKRCRMAVCVDTSIKHLAAAAGIPLIEICLGPADFRKSGAYRSDVVILSSKQACYPCSHFQACSQKSQICGESLNPSAVALAMHHLDQKNWQGLRTVAQEYLSEIHIYRTSLSTLGWLALPMDPHQTGWMLDSFLSRSSWRLYLSNTHKKHIGEYGTEGLQLI
ncbi:MAG: glycosyltransferase family 9 protein, partial [Bdellovibrionales bacterium]|nr:glycosyltransferase family 9 protein [Bdellovibrionales bacterium]